MWRIVLNAVLPALPVVVIGVLVGGRLTPWALVNVAAWPLLLVASIAVHELGHALAARLVGLEVPRITIGVGREVWRARVSHTLIVLHAAPLMGRTWLGSASRSGLRWRMWIAVAGGPLATLVLALGAALLLASPTDLSAHARAMAGELALTEMAFLLNAASLVVNLLPYPSLGSKAHVKDGKALLTLPWAPEEELLELLDIPVLHDVVERMEAYDDHGAQRVLVEALRARPDSFGLRYTLACVEAELGNEASAREACLELLAKATDERSRALGQVCVAAIDCGLRLPEVRDEANELSRLALETLPAEDWTLGVRGAVLVWLERAAEAIPLLERAHLRASSRRARAGHACELAAAHAACRRLETAAEWLRTALAAGARGKHLERARAALRAAEERAGALAAPAR